MRSLRSTGGQRVPNQPKTPSHTYRLPDAVLLPAKSKAERRGETITRVIIRKLGEYNAEPDVESDAA